MGNNPQQEALGNTGGHIEDLIQGKGFGGKGMWAFNTQAPTEQSLLNSYGGMQARDMGQAGQAAGAQSAAYGGTNPYAFLQHAQSGVGNKWADIMAQAPQQAFGMQNTANEGMRNMLLQLLGLQQGVAAKEPTSFGSQLSGSIASSLGPAISSWVSRPKA